jgi:hypothetical protein
MSGCELRRSDAYHPVLERVIPPLSRLAAARYALWIHAVVDDADSVADPSYAIEVPVSALTHPIHYLLLAWESIRMDRHD